MRVGGWALFVACSVAFSGAAWADTTEVSVPSGLFPRALVVSEARMTVGTPFYVTVSVAASAESTAVNAGGAINVRRIASPHVELVGTLYGDGGVVSLPQQLANDPILLSTGGAPHTQSFQLSCSRAGFWIVGLLTHFTADFETTTAFPGSRTSTVDVETATVTRDLAVHVTCEPQDDGWQPPPQTPPPPPPTGTSSGPYPPIEDDLSNEGAADWPTILDQDPSTMELPELLDALTALDEYIDHYRTKTALDGVIGEILSDLGYLRDAIVREIALRVQGLIYEIECEWQARIDEAVAQGQEWGLKVLGESFKKIAVLYFRASWTPRSLIIGPLLTYLKHKAMQILGYEESTSDSEAAALEAAAWEYIASLGLDALWEELTSWPEPTWELEEHCIDDVVPGGARTLDEAIDVLRREGGDAEPIGMEEAVADFD